RDAVLAYDGEPQPVTWAMALENPDVPGLPDEVRSEVRRLDFIRTAPPHPGPLPPGEGRGEGEYAHHPSTLPSQLITVWDRRSLKTDRVTGRKVPDETKRVPLLAYANPRPAEWPAADFIVGNPPFIGKVKLREDLGDGYAETLRATYPEMPESAGFVLYWWHKAATLVRAGKAQRFGLITTNSLRQTFARRVVQMHLNPGSSRREEAQTKSGKSDQSLVTSAATSEVMTLSLVFTIPDHPWVDTADGAAVLTVELAESARELLATITDPKERWDRRQEVLCELARVRREDSRAGRLQIQRERRAREREEEESQAAWWREYALSDRLMSRSFLTDLISRTRRGWIRPNQSESSQIKPVG
ncbi:MAG: hypothetical protein IH623_19130, partial [Verrucomicrobia bacterium]|nr:hypothetical protein [Verrucomicrobiota bacterium]